MAELEPVSAVPDVPTEPVTEAPASAMAESVHDEVHEPEAPMKEPETDLPAAQAPDSRKFKYSRNELLELNKTPSCTTFPSGLELVGPELRDLDKRIPYERGLSPAPSLDAVAGDGMSLKPSWAFGRFGQQANKQANDAAGAKAPPPGFGLGGAAAGPIRSRLVDDGTLKDDERAPALGLGRLGNGAAPWRMGDKEVERDRPRERHPREPWVADSPPEKGRLESDLLKASPPEGRRVQGDRWDKGGESWRAGGGTQAPPKDGWRSTTDRWGGGDERGANNRDTRRAGGGGGGGGWGDDGERRQKQHDAGDDDDGGIGDPFSRGRGGGRGRNMTAAEMEAERQAFRKQLEADKARKQDRPGLRGIYEHEEINLEDLMDDSQKVTLGKSSPAQESTSASGMAGPPGFARPGVGVKMSFEQLAKAAAGAEAAPAQHGAQPATKVGLSVDELEKQMASNQSGGGAAGSGPHGMPGPAGTFGFKADTGASMALMGMLGRGPTPAAAAPTNVPSAAPPPASEARPADGDAGKAFGGLGGLGSLAAAAGGKIPNAVLSAFGEGATKDAYAAFPSLSSIWGAPAAGATGLGTGAPAGALPEATAAAPGQQHAAPATTQAAAAAALFEQLSNAAAAGTNARPPAPGSMLHQQQQQGAGLPGQHMQQQQQAQPLPPQQQQQASHAIMALLQKAGQQQRQQQQQQGQQAGLSALLGQLNRAAGQGRPAGAGGHVDPSTSTPLADDNFNSIFKDLGISPEPSKPKESDGQAGWPQQVRPGMAQPVPGAGGQPGQGAAPLTAKTVQELLAAAGTQQAAQPGQQQQAQQSMQQLQQLLVNGQQRLHLQALQQQMQQPQHPHPQQQQQQQWAPNMLQAMQMQGVRPGMAQGQGQPAGFPANLMQQQQQQQMLQQQMQQRMQQQQASQVNMAAVMQAAQQQQQQQRPQQQQGGFDPALLARLQGAMALGGGGAPPVAGAHPGAHMPGMAGAQGGHPLASALGIQQMMQMQQQLHAARAAVPPTAPAPGAQDPNNLARFFNAAALQQAQAAAMRAPQGAAMPTVSDLERLLGQRR